MIESKDNIFQVFLDSKTMLMTIGLVNGKLVLTHLSFLPYDAPNSWYAWRTQFFKVFDTKNTHAYKIQPFHTMIII